MVRTWTVGPPPEWLTINQHWLREANLPNTEQCPATLNGIRCELVTRHDSTHMIYMKDKPPPTE